MHILWYTYATKKITLKPKKQSPIKTQLKNHMNLYETWLSPKKNPSKGNTIENQRLIQSLNGEIPKPKWPTPSCIFSMVTTILETTS